MERNKYMQEVCQAVEYAPMDDYADAENSCPASMTTEAKPLEALFLVFHIFFTIVPILFSVAIAVLASRKIHFSCDTWKFLLDIGIIVIPIILNVTICNPFVEVICVVLAIITFLVFKRNNISPIVDKNKVIRLGHQPNALSLLRSSINIITAVCILAIDFKSFPKMFRKSRTYGVGLMDTGIGLFVFSMGAVSKPPRTRRDFMRLPKMVGPALLLGLLRTIVLTAIDYDQDVTEYGRHMNAFFTLGLTKLFGSLISSILKSELQLLLLGAIILITHESLLLLGLGPFLMDDKNTRETFFDANREGIGSLPGFLGIYLISMCIVRSLYSKPSLLFQEYSTKVKRLSLGVACSWVMLLLCIGTSGISRRVSNFGYVTWTMSIALTMLLFYIFIYDYAFHAWSESEQCKLPPLMEATNRNGLVFFLIANVLTGCVNVFLKPGGFNAPISILILSVYMLLSTSTVYALLRKGIKIA